MSPFIVEIQTNPTDWDRLCAALPGQHILQAWSWGEFKEKYGWRAHRFAWGNQAAAQVLSRSAGRGLVQVLYVPRGPVLDWGDTALVARVLDDLQTLAHRQRAIFIKLDPALPLASGPFGAEQPNPVGESVRAELLRRGWRFSPDQIQFRNTVTLDLTRPEAELLAALKQKTRYNVRLAEKKGVAVRLGTAADLELLYRLYAETSVRDGFVIRGRDYYLTLWAMLMERGLAQPLMAEVEGEAVSAVVLFKFGQTAWYFYGMSRTTHREKMPNHLLQWRAIQWAQAQGCATYDFWGAPDDFVESDSMWGVWKFKEGFNGSIVRGLGAWDYAPSNTMYSLYTQLLPRVLNVLRRRGQAETKRVVGE